MNTRQELEEELTNVSEVDIHALLLVVRELRKAREKFPEWPDDIIHQSAIINEEAGELTQACLEEVYEGRDPFGKFKEAKQVGAATLRFLTET